MTNDFTILTVPSMSFRSTAGTQARKVRSKLYVANILNRDWEVYKYLRWAGSVVVCHDIKWEGIVDITPLASSHDNFLNLRWITIR